MARRINLPTICPTRAERLRGWVAAGIRPAEMARREGVCRSNMTAILQRYGFRRGVLFQDRGNA